jgi:hypothetical protein
MRKGEGENRPQKDKSSTLWNILGLSGGEKKDAA